MITKKYLLNRIEELEKEVRNFKYSEPEFFIKQTIPYYQQNQLVYQEAPKKSMVFVLQSILDYLDVEFYYQVGKDELRKKGENP